MDERRSFKRLPAETKDKIRPRADASVATATAKDPSGSAIQFHCAKRLAVGSLADT